MPNIIYLIIKLMAKKIIIKLQLYSYKNKIYFEKLNL